jgi:hypothetical protein
MSDKEMKTLLPGRNITLSNGEEVWVAPVPFGKSLMFADAVTALFEKLGDKGLKLENLNDWKTLFKVAFEETLGIMGLVLDKPREFFDGIDLADGLELLDVIIEQNYSERAKKNIRSLLDRLGSQLPTQSRFSSAQAIASKILKSTPQGKSSSSPEASQSSGRSKEGK